MHVVVLCVCSFYMCMLSRRIEMHMHFLFGFFLFARRHPPVARRVGHAYACHMCMLSQHIEMRMHLLFGLFLVARRLPVGWAIHVHVVVL